MQTQWLFCLLPEDTEIAKYSTYSVLSYGFYSKFHTLNSSAKILKID